MRRERMARRMWMEAVDPGRPSGAAGEPAHGAIADPPSRALHEQRTVVAPALAEPLLHRGDSRRTDRHPALLATLALPHPDPAVREVEIGEVECAQLGDTKPPAVQHLEDRAIAGAERALGVEQAVGLGDG